jgi:hypothetical protein
MPKAVRIVSGLVIVGLVLYAAGLATRDCTIAPYVYDNCMWLRVRAHLGLPASRLLRMVTMECVGIVLASALYLTFKHIFPSRNAVPSPEEPTRIPAPPSN